MRFTVPSEGLKAMFVDALQQHGLSLRPYSGRGMYGRTCVGVVGHRSTIFEALGDFLAQAHNDVFDDLRDISEDDDAGFEAVSRRSDNYTEFASSLLATFNQDNMGFDDIVYWPEWAYEDDPVDENPEDE